MALATQPGEAALEAYLAVRLAGQDDAQARHAVATQLGVEPRDALGALANHMDARLGGDLRPGPRRDGLARLQAQCAAGAA